MGFLLSKHNKQYVVMIEGNIGIGKSTLLQSLQKAGYTVMQEPVDTWMDFHGINFLQLFCADMKKWAFTFQIMALFTLWKEQQKLMASSAKIIVVERSLSSVLKMFVSHHVSSGNISEEQHAVLINMTESLSKLINREEVFVYLRADPTTAYKRVQTRARNEERSIPFKYFEDLHSTLEDWLPLHHNLKATIDATTSPDTILKNVLITLQQLL